MTAAVSFGRSAPAISDDPLAAIIRNRYEVTLIPGAYTAWGEFYHTRVWDSVECEYVAETRETRYYGYCVHEIMVLELEKLFPDLPVDELPAVDCECECEED